MPIFTPVLSNSRTFSIAPPLPFSSLDENAKEWAFTPPFPSFFLLREPPRFSPSPAVVSGGWHGMTHSSLFSAPNQERMTAPPPFFLFFSFPPYADCSFFSSQNPKGNLISPSPLLGPMKRVTPPFSLSLPPYLTTSSPSGFVLSASGVFPILKDVSEYAQFPLHSPLPPPLPRYVPYDDSFF